MAEAGYEIRVKGYLDPHWSEWLADLTITYDGDGNTLLSGQVADQAALHGILAQLRDLGMPLISIMPQTEVLGT